MRRRGPWGLLAVLFVVVPLLEIYLVIQVGQAIGAAWTVVLLVLDSILGAVLLKREGAAAWRALRDALSSYRMPARELADGVLVLVGGTLLLTPGFMTDVLGFFFILPFTRPVARRVLTTVITRKFLASDGRSSEEPQTRGSQTRGSQTRSSQTRQSPGPDSVVQGEVVD
ncbi:MAG TPA: FxsA family protein [Nocardioidaceae bacterium]|nr:FxsA family protein [Nocardioidaceae bacterium]